MTCPKPDVLSQWADGSLDPRESLVVGRHAETCAACRRKAEELRAVGSWIASAADPGPSCLSIDDMAAVLEGGRVPAHVRTCPRCASEFRALRSGERKATRRRQKPAAPMTAWAAAAAVFVAVGILFVVATRQTSQPEDIAVRVTPRPSNVEPASVAPTPVPPVTAPKPVAVPQKETPKPEVLPPTPPTPRPAETPTPAPIVEQPKPETPKPATSEPAREVTRVEAPRPVVALNVRSGGLSSLSDGKWVKATKIEEGMALRAEGRTQVDYAQARLTIDGASRFSMAKDEVTLNDGGLSAEIAQGSKLVLVLEDHRINPQTLNSRVIIAARADRFVVEEGSAKIKDALALEGVEHSVKKDRVEAQKRRTLPAAARARELRVWGWDLSKAEIVARHLGAGRVERDGDNRLLVSERVDNPIFYGQAGYFNGDGEPPLFVVKPNTAIRFRYFQTQPGHFELILKNGTKDENFNKTLEPVLKQWTTVTLYVKDVPVNQGGKKVGCDLGDKYTGIGWFVGKPGAPSELYIDRFEILEIDR